MLAPGDVEKAMANPLFKALPPEVLSWVASRVTVEHFEPGQIVVREGEAADRLYVITAGVAVVVSQDLAGEEAQLNRLQDEAVFGEIALLRGEARQATVRAETDLRAVSLAADDFRELRSHFPKFAYDIEDGVDELLVEKQLRRASPFARLPSALLRRVIGSLGLIDVRTDTDVIKQGEPGEDFYLIWKGSVEILKDGKRLQVMREGDYFGEAALLSGGRRTATAHSLEPTSLLTLRASSFKEIVSSDAALEGHFSEMVKLRTGEELEDEKGDEMPEPTLRGIRRYSWYVLAGGIAAFVAASLAAVTLQTQFLSYVVIVVGSLVGPAAFVTFIAESDVLRRKARELVVTFVLAGTVSAAAAYAVETHLAWLSTTWQGSIATALIEEPLKLVAVLWLLRLAASRFEMDGLVYGAAAGMGFAAAENVLFGLAAPPEVGSLLNTLWTRALLSPFGHGTWTAIVCAAIWHSKEARRRADRWTLLAFLAAIGLHSLWDLGPTLFTTLPSWFASAWLLLVGVVGVFVLITVLQAAFQDELKVVVRLNPEVGQAGAVGTGVTCQWCDEPAPKGTHYCARCGAALRITWAKPGSRRRP